MLHRADTALYRAKAEGRSRLVAGLTPGRAAPPAVPDGAIGLPGTAEGTDGSEPGADGQRPRQPA
jgi:hypothetical protein